MCEKQRHASACIAPGLSLCLILFLSVSVSFPHASTFSRAFPPPLSEASGRGSKVPPLFAKTEWTANGTLWSARLSQCVCGQERCAEGGEGACTCAANSVAPAGSRQPKLTMEEDGFARAQLQIELRSPLCPERYHVLGHVASIVGVAVPDNYKCIHQRLLRRAGDAQGNTLYKSHVPLDPLEPRQPVSIWSDTSSVNPTIIPEYLAPINIYVPNCHFVACPETTSFGLCENDTTSQGLFYADRYPPMRITASRNPDDVENLAPWVGPRCLTHYRACDDDCDYELGLSPVHEDPDSDGIMQPAQRRGLVYAKPWGFPLQKGDDETGPEASSFFTELLVHPRVCSTFNYKEGQRGTYPWVFLNYYPKPGQYKLEGAVRAQSVSFASSQQPWCIIDLIVTYDHLEKYPTRTGPVVVRIRRGGVGDDVDKYGDAVLEALAEEDAFEVGRSVGKIYFYTSPGKEAEVMPKMVYNGPDCVANFFIALPAHVQAMDYYQGTCRWRDHSSNPWSLPRASALMLEHVPRGITCVIPPRTGPDIQVQVSLNGQHFHTMDMRAHRVDSMPGVPGHGAVRMYGVSPRSGDSQGGTLVTVFGAHFNQFRDNTLQCRFRFLSGAGDIDVLVAGVFIDDGH